MKPHSGREGGREVSQRMKSGTSARSRTAVHAAGRAEGRAGTRIERTLATAERALSAAVGRRALGLLLAGLVGVKPAQRRLRALCRRKRAAAAVFEFLRELARLMREGR